jgi:hypothetical protein
MALGPTFVCPEAYTAVHSIVLDSNSAEQTYCCPPSVVKGLGDIDWYLADVERRNLHSLRSPNQRSVIECTSTSQTGRDNFIRERHFPHQHGNCHGLRRHCYAPGQDPEHQPFNLDHRTGYLREHSQYLQESAPVRPILCRWNCTVHFTWTRQRIRCIQNDRRHKNSPMSCVSRNSAAGSPPLLCVFLLPARLQIRRRIRAGRR